MKLKTFFASQRTYIINIEEIILNWTEVKISVRVSDLETASGIAVMAVPYGIYIEDYSTLETEAFEGARADFIDEELLQKDRSAALIHIYIPSTENPNEATAFISERLAASNIPYSIECADCCDEDWANSWKKHYKPIFIGERLVICPAWIKLGDTKGRKVLLIEPGAAFGSGTHETTRLCLDALDRTIKDGDTVLDIGCGSGILSIASLLLGAKEAFCVDIDVSAVKTARENGELNGLREPEFTVVHGSLADGVKMKYRVIVANIVADVIMSFSDDAYSLTENGGTFIVSGIIDSRRIEVENALITSGFKIKERLSKNGWVCLVLKNNK